MSGEQREPADLHHSPHTEAPADEHDAAGRGADGVTAERARRKRDVQ
jgi:hypothetical protein